MSAEFFSPKDRDARRTFDAFQSEIGPLISQLLPSFRLTYIGFNRIPDNHSLSGADEIQIKLHLLPLGESFKIQRQLEDAATSDSFNNKYLGDKNE